MKKFRVLDMISGNQILTVFLSSEITFVSFFLEQNSLQRIVFFFMLNSILSNRSRYLLRCSDVVRRKKNYTEDKN